MKKIIEYLIKKFLGGYHLSRNPRKGRKNKVKTENKGEKEVEWKQRNG